MGENERLVKNYPIQDYTIPKVKSRFESQVIVTNKRIVYAQKITDKKGGTNRCYEVRVEVFIDGNTYGISYPVMNGINPVRDELMNQNAVHKAQMRAFVKCVAINTGLGFDLWADDADIGHDEEDLSKHNIYAIRERMQQTYTKLVKRGLSTSEIAKMMGTSEQTVQYYLNCIFDEINRFEKAMSAL